MRSSTSSAKVTSSLDDNDDPNVRAGIAAIRELDQQLAEHVRRERLVKQQTAELLRVSTQPGPPPTDDGDDAEAVNFFALSQPREGPPPADAAASPAAPAAAPLRSSTTDKLAAAVHAAGSPQRKSSSSLVTDHVQRNIDLAAHTGELVPMTAEEKLRLRRLLGEDGAENDDDDDGSNVNDAHDGDAVGDDGHPASVPVEDDEHVDADEQVASATPSLALCDDETRARLLELDAQLQALVPVGARAAPATGAASSDRLAAIDAALVALQEQPLTTPTSDEMQRLLQECRVDDYRTGFMKREQLQPPAAQ
jgi:hypothetical protein